MTIHKNGSDSDQARLAQLDRALASGAKGTSSDHAALQPESTDVRFSAPSYADPCGKPGPCAWCDAGELEFRLLRVETGEGVYADENLEDDALYLAAEVRRQRESLRVMSVNEGKLHAQIAELETRLGRVQGLPSELYKNGVDAGCGGAPDAAEAYEHAAVKLRRVLNG